MEKQVVLLFNDTFKVPCATGDIDYVRKVGRKTNSYGPIVVSLTNQKLKRQLFIVFINKKNLKYRSISIADDLPAEIRDKRKSLIPMMLKHRAEGKRACIRSLYIGRRPT